MLVLVCYGASRTPGYTGLAICELVFAALVLLAWGCRLPPRLPVIHWGWTVSWGGGTPLPHNPPQPMGGGWEGVWGVFGGLRDGLGGVGGALGG